MSDTSILNFINNHKVTLRYNGKQWIATAKERMVMGDNIRQALTELKRMCRDE